MANDIGALTGLTDRSSVEQLQSVNSLAENFDNFLTILTTQLQNQDPLSPLDTHEFTNQLVMFADVEQSVRQSGLLENMINFDQQNQATAAVGYISKMITADHNELNYKGGSASFSYTMPEEAATATMQIYDSSGELVRLVNGVEGSIGTHSFEWDGLDQNGNQMPDGAYSFQVGATNANDQPISPTYTTTGTVTGVEFADGETTLLMGTVAVPLERVQRVEEIPAV